MTIFNKLIAFLTIMSFLASDNIYAAPHRDDLGDRTRGVRKTPLKNPVKNIRPAAKGTPRRAPNLRLKAELEKAKKQALQALKTRQNASAGKKPMQKRTVGNTRPSAKPTPNNAQKNGNVAGRARANSTPTPNNAQKNGNVAGRARAKSTPIPNNAPKNGNVARAPQHKVALAPNNAAKKANTARAVQPKVIPAPNNTANKVNVAKAVQPNIKKLVPTPVNNPKKTPIKGPQAKSPLYYDLQTKHLPADLRKKLELVGFADEGEGVKGQRVTLQELRKGLRYLEKIEKLAPGMTNKIRGYLTSIGYNPNGAGNISIVTSRLPQEFKNILEMVDDEDNDLPPVITLSQAKTTKMLDKLKKCEDYLPGLTESMRSFLKKQYGFQG